MQEAESRIMAVPIKSDPRLTRSLRSPAGTVDIDRRSGLSHREFVRSYLRPLKPVVMPGAIDQWPALGQWTPEFFRTRFAGREITIDGRTLTVGDLIDLIERSTAENPAPYLRNLLVADWAPELLPAISPMPDCTKPNWFDSRFFPASRSLSAIELYIGGAGASFPILHYDNMHTHAFLMQLWGTKEYLAYPPEQSQWLYPRPGIERNKSSIPDIDHPDLARFPLLANATPYRTLLHGGETLFVPSGWWHTARILEPSITVSINTLNRTNWRSFYGDYVAAVRRHQPRWRAIALALYTALFGTLEQFLGGL
jgi:hypothetical protein